MSGCEDEDYSIVGQMSEVAIEVDSDNTTPQVEVIQAMLVRFKSGIGVPSHPRRTRIAIYTMDGKCIAVRDEYEESRNDK